MLTNRIQELLPVLNISSASGELADAAVTVTHLALDADAAREEAHLYLVAASQVRREFREHMATAASNRVRIGPGEPVSESLTEIARVKEALDEAVQLSRQEQRYRSAAHAAFERARLDHQEILALWKTLRSHPDVNVALDKVAADDASSASPSGEEAPPQHDSPGGGARLRGSRLQAFFESTAAFQAALHRQAQVDRTSYLGPTVSKTARLRRVEPSTPLAPPSSGESDAPFASETTDGPQAALLTPRQREIAALIARGYTNRQIAEHLVLSKGTVANHVEHILNRLGFQNRAKVASWAAALGLSATGELPDEPDGSR
jgi:DNA-binding CsgD family transcriptional regulator